MRNSLLCQKLLFPYALTPFPLRAPPCAAGVARSPLRLPGSAEVVSYSLARSPLRLPGSADIY